MLREGADFAEHTLGAAAESTALTPNPLTPNPPKTATPPEQGAGDHLGNCLLPAPRSLLLHLAPGVSASSAVE